MPRPPRWRGSAFAEIETMKIEMFSRACFHTHAAGGAAGHITELAVALQSAQPDPDL